MKNKKILFYLPEFLAIISMVTISSCAFLRDNYEIDFLALNTLPPNGIKISENFYCDRNEVTNIDYKEFEYFVIRNHGRNSKAHGEILPDTQCWLKIDTCLLPLVYYYYQDPMFQNCPVVGISQEQARKYSKWRSDRVFEMFLIENKILEITPSKYEDHFTIENFYSGKHIKIVSNKKVPYYPEFRLPTKKERKKILLYSDFMFSKKENKKYHPNIYCGINPCVKDSIVVSPLRGLVFDNLESRKNDLRIYDLRGNVAEWMNEENTASGGSWIDLQDLITNEDIRSYMNASAVTGFRNVFEWKKYIAK